MEKISDDPELLDSVYFFMDGQTTEDYTFSHVSDSFETTIRMLDEDEPQDLILYFDVQDHTEPDIQDAEDAVELPAVKGNIKFENVSRNTEK